jgi:hypothetical protein
MKVYMLIVLNHVLDYIDEYFYSAYRCDFC